MAITFHAHMLDISEEDWGTRIILSVDGTLEAERYLMTQRKHTFSEQEVRFGMDDVYIETCGQGWSWYGHIDVFELFDNRIRVQLDAVAAHRIGDDGVIEVSFDLTDDERAALRAALRKTFAGRTCYVDLNDRADR
jgi:Immunity protein 10